ncbi:MAG: hypothetical protein AAFU79_03500, partial [Myxococcota bacterium]
RGARLMEGLTTLINRIYGPRHWTVRCLCKSVITTGLILIAGTTYILIFRAPVDKAIQAGIAGSDASAQAIEDSVTVLIQETEALDRELEKAEIELEMARSRTEAVPEADFPEYLRRLEDESRVSLIEERLDEKERETSKLFHERPAIPVFNDDDATAPPLRWSISFLLLVASLFILAAFPDYLSLYQTRFFIDYASIRGNAFLVLLLPLDAATTFTLSFLAPFLLLLLAAAAESPSQVEMAIRYAEQVWVAVLASGSITTLWLALFSVGRVGADTLRSIRPAYRYAKRVLDTETRPLTSIAIVICLAAIWMMLLYLGVREYVLEPLWPGAFSVPPSGTSTSTVGAK